VSGNSQKDSFPKVLLQNLRDFPFVPEVNNTFVGIINKLTKHKKTDLITDTISLENEIDRMVYELYGLTEEEIKIVENS
jgi:hypothetical protein